MIQTNLSATEVRDLTANLIQRNIDNLALSGIKTDSSNILLNVGKHHIIFFDIIFFDLTGRLNPLSRKQRL